VFLAPRPIRQLAQAPEGRPSLAHRFSGGKMKKMTQVPEINTVAIIKAIRIQQRHSEPTLTRAFTEDVS